MQSFLVCCFNQEAVDLREEPRPHLPEASSSNGSRRAAAPVGSALLDRLHQRPDIYAQVAQLAAAGVVLAGQRAQVNFYLLLC